MASPRLIYICSIGHSGSTLLDFLTGSIEGVFSAGEMRYYSWQLLHGSIKPPSIENQNICTCLNPFDRCPVWSTVTDRISSITGIDIASDPLSFRIGYTRPQSFTRSIPKRQLLLRRLVGSSARIRGLGFLSRISERLQRQVTDNNWNLINALAETAGAQFVVDSTKDPFRFSHIRRGREQDVSLIVLTRDPYGIAWSSEKRGRDPVPVVKQWLRFYSRLEKLLANTTDMKSGTADVHFVNYEDLCSDPFSVRAAIAAFLGLSEPGAALDIDTRDYHLIAGNPMRYRGPLTIREDTSWREGLSRSTESFVRDAIEGTAVPDFLRHYADHGGETAG